MAYHQGEPMKPHAGVHHEGAPTWPEQILEEVIRQLPLGLICTDLDGKVLFMNAAAQELLTRATPVGEFESPRSAQRLPELPGEIRRGIEYFSGLLTQPQWKFMKPFPKLYVQNHGNPPGYDLEFFLYCALDEVTRETWTQARILILVKSVRLMMPTVDLGRRFSLTNRERQVLQYLTAGKARKEIAAAMNLSEDTIRSYLRRLYEKLGVGSRVEAVILGLRMELLEHLQSVLQIQK